MSPGVEPQIVQRLLVAKQLLAANGGQLTPNSDAVAVARTILAAHDAAELAAAAIAAHLGVPGLSDRTFLTEYSSKIESHTGKPFPGADYLRQLNAARIGFKHHGTLPDARQWYTAIDRTWDWVDKWCIQYVGISLAEIDLENLLADPKVKAEYALAKEHHLNGRYPEALEALGRALFWQLRYFSGPWGTRVGVKNSEDALMLAPFGVRPADFLALQEFLPRVSYATKTRAFTVEWDRRKTGHEANWTQDNVRFCLLTFLDLALKIQHAPSVPTAWDFYLVFDDVVEPKGESVDLFVYEFDPYGAPLGSPKGRRTVRTLRKGEKLRCVLAVSNVREDVGEGAELGALSAVFAQANQTVDTADILMLLTGEGDLPDVMYVERKNVTISAEPKDIPGIRSLCPHLFSDEKGK